MVKQQSFIKQIAVKNYLQSERFMKELADITNELSKYGQKDIDKGISTDPIYSLYKGDEEKLQNQEIFKWLQYYVTTKEHYYRNNVMSKFFENGVGFYNQTQAMINESVFYLHITCKDGEEIQVDSSMYADKNIPIYLERLNKLRQQNKHQYGVKCAEEFEIHFFIPKDISINEDMVIQGTKQVNLFVFLMIQMISVIVYCACLFIVNRFIKKEERYRQIKIPFWVRIISYTGIFFLIRWLFTKANEQGVTCEIMLERESGILFWAFIMLVFLSILGYEINLLINKVEYAINEKGMEPILDYTQTNAKKLYEYLGIDLDHRCWMKVAKLNIIHLLVVGIIAWIVRYSTACGITLMVLWCTALGTLVNSFLKDWNQFISHLEKNTLVQYTEEITRLGKYSAYAWETFFAYCVTLFVVTVVTSVSAIGYLSAIVLVGLIYFISWKIVDMVYEIYDYADQILEHDKENIEKTGFFRPIIGALERAEESFNEAVQREVASERMKAELISNVSHDLKTPLTAIISYIDLLKREELSPEEQKKYIEILDQKSQRLKALIEDLFEASKAASGNIKLNMEEIDLVALLKQTLGEMSEKVGKSQLQFKVTVPEYKLMSQLDGRRTYRIFENLINNIIKYAAPYSRVYIECKEEEREHSVVFKNISAKEMNFTAEEIVERFKRGDESRHTEGSGLGLAIAKNLTELQGGMLEVYIDGDLFKVSVKFPKVQAPVIKEGKQVGRARQATEERQDKSMDSYQEDDLVEEENQGIGSIIKKHVKNAIEEIRSNQAEQEIDCEEEDERIDLRDCIAKNTHGE